MIWEFNKEQAKRVKFENSHVILLIHWLYFYTFIWLIAAQFVYRSDIIPCYQTTQFFMNKILYSISYNTSKSGGAPLDSDLRGPWDLVLFKRHSKGKILAIGVFWRRICWYFMQNTCMKPMTREEAKVMFTTFKVIQNHQTPMLIGFDVVGDHLRMTKTVYL